MMSEQAVLMIFAKAPNPGQVKTRLIPEVGKQKATELYKEFLNIVLETAVKANFSEIQLWVSGDINHKYITQLLRKYKVSLYQQQGKDLGERMSYAFANAFNKYSNAVVIGSDCPSLHVSDLDSAVEYLHHNSDVVLGPAVDGGYYLIGLNQNAPELFKDVHWGEETVFNETCNKISKMNLSLGLLTKRTDVDTAADLELYYKIQKS